MLWGHIGLGLGVFHTQLFLSCMRLHAEMYFGPAMHMQSYKKIVVVCEIGEEEREIGGKGGEGKKGERT